MLSSSHLLPTSRQLLTSLLNAIGDIPVPPQRQHDLGGTTQGQGYPALNNSRPAAAAAPGSNALRLIHPSHRALFTTLHVLFPALLLPALDLLDRGLVARLVLLQRKADTGTGRGAAAQPAVEGGDAPPSRGHEPQPVEDGSPQSTYFVRSAQTTTARRPYGGGGGGFSTTETPAGQAYIVHAAAWNCTCAAFAFAAFPASGPAPATATVDPGSEIVAEGDFTREIPDAVDAAEPEPEPEPGWEFGGLSCDGVEAEGEGSGGGVPCCKHLLACVLAERWPGGLGTHVVERHVSREEMAGIVADV